mgnify:CR=1 FL=1
MIELKHLSKTFETADGRVDALKDVSLTIPDGDVYGIIGMSGAGKSTLVRCINMLERPTEGEVIVNGQRLDTMTPAQLRAARREITMIFQRFNLLMQRNCLDNVCFPMELSGLRGEKKWREQRALELLEIVGLKDKAKAYPAQLSGGQQQRVAIARALATRPKYLLCDEATSALDPNTTQSILHLLKEINQTLGVTIVVITHEMRVIEQICQRVAVIDQSCIAEIGNVSDVFTHPKSDIAKALILPKSPAENLPPCTGKRLRLVFDGSCSNEPVISRITLECHVPVNILFADTRIVEGSIYGHMVIDLPDDPQQFHDVLRWLDHNHISYLQEDGSHV